MSSSSLSSSSGSWWRWPLALSVAAAAGVGLVAYRQKIFSRKHSKCCQGSEAEHSNHSSTSSALPAASPSSSLSSASTADIEARSSLYSVGPYTKLTHSDVSNILQSYDFGPLVSFQALMGGLTNSNYLVEGSKRKVLLKVCEEKDLRSLCVQTIVLKLFEEFQVPHVSRAHPKIGSLSSTLTAADEFVLSIPNFRPIVAYEFLHGQHPKSANVNIIQELAAALAAVHSLPVSVIDKRLSQCSPPLALPPFPMGLSVMDPFLQSEIHSYQVTSHPFVGLLSSTLSVIRPSLTLSGLPEAVCHGDVFLENSLFDGDKLVAIIDWEELSKAPAILDLAMTLVGCCYDENNNLIIPFAEALLKGYQSKRNLTENEQKVFPDFLKYALLSIALWRFKQFNFIAPDVKRQNSYEHMVIRLKNVNEEQIKDILNKTRKMDDKK